MGRDDPSPGALTRLGTILMVLSLFLIIVAYPLAARASAVYWVMVTAHALVCLGYLIRAVEDKMAGRKFSWPLLGLVLMMVFGYVIVGPILMSAVAVSQGS